MKQHPMIFTSDSMREILDSRKTQTRRVITPQPPDWWDWRAEAAKESE